MDNLDFTKRRLKVFLAEITRLKGSDFPHANAEVALGQIEHTFEEQLEALRTITSKNDKSTVANATRRAVEALRIYLPLLGFLLRSTNVRNAFEIHGPLQRLARSILGESTSLILSSEWDYSPFTYLGIPVLKGFVLIGIPASESGNPLLIPLAGHELGHAIWRDKHVQERISKRLEDKVLAEIRGSKWDQFSNFFPGIKKDHLTQDLFSREAWEPAYTWSIRQAEETFCDFVGIRLFRESFLHAFRYLLAPNLGGRRQAFYPNTLQRVANLRRAAKALAVECPDEYADLFENLPEPDSTEPWSRLLLDLADTALDSFVAELIEVAVEIIDAALSTKGDLSEEASNASDEVYQVYKKLVVPCEDASNLWDIINGAWKAYLDEALWENVSHLDKDAWDRTLRELVLKNIEVLEFKHITSQP